MSEDQDKEWTIQSSPLRLKNRVVTEEIPEAPRPVERPVQKHKAKNPGRASGRFGVKFLSQSIGSFLVGILIFGAFIYHQINGLDILTPQQAIMARGIAVISFFVILVIEAFTEDLLQGVLSLFLPPYAFVYGLLFADAGPIRGLTMAMLVFLGAEIFLYENRHDALVPKTFSAINTWIEDGQQALINPDKPDAGYE